MLLTPGLAVVPDAILGDNRGPQATPPARPEPTGETPHAPMFAALIVSLRPLLARDGDRCGLVLNPIPNPPLQEKAVPLPRLRPSISSSVATGPSGPRYLPDIPAVREAGWGRNSIDRFILAGLEEVGFRVRP